MSTGLLETCRWFK